MAVAYRAGNNDYDQGVRVATVTKPTGLEVGDVMLAQFCYPYDETPVVPSGFTLITTAKANKYKQSIYYKVATASDVAASSFEFSYEHESFSDDVAAGIVAFSGQSVPEPYHTYSKDDNGDASLSIPSMGCLANSCLVMFIMGEVLGNVDDYAIATNNPSWTEVWGNNVGEFNISCAYSAVRPEGTDTGAGTVTEDFNEISGVLVSIPPYNSIVPTEETCDPTDLNYDFYNQQIKASEISTEEDVYTGELDKWTETSKSSTSWTNTSK